MNIKPLINVYDFDHTIYNGDASFDFIKYCLVRYPHLWKYLPIQVLWLIRYVFGISSRTQVKEGVFSFLRDIHNVDFIVECFWRKHDKKIINWYHAQHRDSDIIISASPEFLLRPMATKLDIPTLIATNMDKLSGKIVGKNCHGDEKLIRLHTYNPSIIIDSFYSDSLSDMPLFQIAKHPFVVRGKRIIKLSEYRPTRLQLFKKPAFLRFLFVGGVNALLGVLFAYILLGFLKNPILAFIFGYLASLVISYFLNAVVTFKDTSFSINQFIRFVISYIPNFLFQLVFVHILVNILNIYPLISYILAVVLVVPITFLLLSKFTFTKEP